MPWSNAACKQDQENKHLGKCSACCTAPAHICSLYRDWNQSSTSRSPTAAVPESRRQHASDTICCEDGQSLPGSQGTCSATCPTERGSVVRFKSCTFCTLCFTAKAEKRTQLSEGWFSRMSFCFRRDVSAHQWAGCVALSVTSWKRMQDGGTSEIAQDAGAIGSHEHVGAAQVAVSHRWFVCICKKTCSKGWFEGLTAAKFIKQDCLVWLASELSWESLAYVM